MFLSSHLPVGFFSKQKDTGSGSYERCAYFGAESSGGPGSKDEHAHGTVKSGQGLYFAFLEDAKGTFSEVRNSVHLQAPILCLPTPFLPTMHKNAQNFLKIFKTCF